MPAPAPCRGRVPAMSMCWSLRGLWRRRVPPYKRAQMPANAMPPVEIYTTRFCPYCSAAKTLLKRKGVSYREIDVSSDFERREEMIQRANGRMTVPQIFIGATHVGGSDELHALERPAGSIRCWRARRTMSQAVVSKRP